MESERFDAVVRALAATGSRRRVLGGLLTAAVTGLRPSWTAAEEIAAAGNGGTADASGNGGAVATGTINSGANAGNAIGVDDTVGSVAVDGGASANATGLEVATEGETSISDAGGGSENLAFREETCPNPVACPGTRARNDCGPAGSDCACWPTTEGDSFCGQNDFCLLESICATSADCPGEEVCVATCCDDLTCVLPCGQFRSTELGAAGSGGRTALGR